MDASILFDSDGETVTRAATAALTRRGLYVVRSFDLRSALTPHANCDCPHHGTAQCTCQFVVLLVYGEAAAPLVLTLHSHDDRTSAQIVRDAANAPDPHLAEQVMAALTEAALTAQTQNALASVE
ncbi:MAG: hypothetical protein HZB20_05180 [Chloroflexi bacterium]|nr:hypothetical protein [Chloroflexota bacterium]